MHVHTETRISPNEVKARFESAATGGAGKTGATRRLIYAAGRTPPKFFLSGVSAMPPAAAEIAISERPGGTDVVLRLMWGPLPAPFPRVLVMAGILLGLMISFFSNGSTGEWVAALLVTLVPVAALLYQQSGERRIQALLGELLGGVRFSPKPH